MGKLLKHIAILIAGLICCCSIQAQRKSFRMTSGTINWGLNVGINALSSSNFEVYQGDTKLDEASYRNKIGFTGSTFFRFNLGDLFLQPEATYYYSQEKISLGQLPDTENYYGSVRSAFDVSHHSLLVPVLAGYNIIKQGRYLFNVYLGPSFQYHYKTSFNQMNSKFVDTSPQYSINGIIGISYNISHIFFDFRYMINYPNTNVNFNKIPDSPEFLKDISIKKNENMLSFSCGLMF